MFTPETVQGTRSKLRHKACKSAKVRLGLGRAGAANVLRLPTLTAGRGFESLRKSRAPVTPYSFIIVFILVKVWVL